MFDPDRGREEVALGSSTQPLICQGKHRPHHFTSCQVSALFFPSQLDVIQAPVWDPALKIEVCQHPHFLVTHVQGATVYGELKLYLDVQAFVAVSVQYTLVFYSPLQFSPTPHPILLLS